MAKDLKDGTAKKAGHDVPVEVEDQALDGAAGGNLISDVLSKISQARSDISKTLAKNIRA